MCGIVGAIAERNIVPILMEGLSASSTAATTRPASRCWTADARARSRAHRRQGRAARADARERAAHGRLGIAHTRWATHGVPTERNAHPHHLRRSRRGRPQRHHRELRAELRAELIALGYEFTSETDTEVIAHLVHHYLKTGKDLLSRPCGRGAALDGAYALARGRARTTRSGSSSRASAARS